MPVKKSSGLGDLRTLSAAEICRVDQAFPKYRDATRNRALFHLWINSGLRLSEILSLTINDVFQGGKFTGRINAKTFGKERRVTILGDGVEAVREYAKQRVINGASETAPLFYAPRSPENPITPNVAWAVVRKSLRRAGINNISTHSLRRTFVKSLVEQGADILEVQRVGGYRGATGASWLVEKAFLKQARKPKDN